MSIEQYELYDFLTDDSFRKWAENPNSREGNLWQTILDAHPEKKYLAETAKNIIQSGQYKDLDFEADETQALWEQIRNDTFGKKQIGIKSKRTNWNWTFLYRAAAIIIPFVAGAIFALYNQSEPKPEPQPVAEQLEKRTQKGQKLQITFTDGTRVKLNADSRLTYPRTFAADTREVYLEGEAFFDVAPNPVRPFIVHTGNISTRVLGTSFNVRTYPEDEAVKVAVVTGKVMVESKTESKGKPSLQPIYLLPSEMVTYDKKKLTANVNPIDIDKIIAWNKDILIFNNARFSEVVDQLERWYGVEFIINRKAPIKKGFSGTFESQSLEYVLEGISYTSDFKYKIQGNTVIIK